MARIKEVQLGKIYKRKNGLGYIHTVVLKYRADLGEVVFCYMSKPEETRTAYVYAFLQTFELVEGGYD